MKVTTDACLFGAWVSGCLQAARKQLDVNLTATRSMLDIGAGTGLLSLMIRQQHQDLSIDAIELDAAAAAQARDNFQRSAWGSSLQLRQGDINDYTPLLPYDIIVSNPPFYEQHLRGADPRRNRALHEETLSLIQLVRFIGQHLKKKGSFFLLLPYHRTNEIMSLLTSHELCIDRIITVRPSPSKSAFRVMIQGSRTLGSSLPLKEEMDIEVQQGHYSIAFRELLSDYYLAC